MGSYKKRAGPQVVGGGCKVRVRLGGLVTASSLLDLVLFSSFWGVKGGYRRWFIYFFKGLASPLRFFLDRDGKSKGARS